MIRDVYLDDDGRVRVWRPCETCRGRGGWFTVVWPGRKVWVTCPDCGGRGERPC